MPRTRTISRSSSTNPAVVRSLRVTTGRPDGGDKLDAGTLQISADGKTFEEVAKFRAGVAETKLDGTQIQAIRIKPSQGP